MIRDSAKLPAQRSMIILIGLMVLLVLSGPVLSLDTATENQIEHEPVFFTVVGDEQLTSNGWSSNADWGPDGSQIAYVYHEGPLFGNVPGGGDIWIMNSDGTVKHQVTVDGLDNRNPSWRPDGQRLVFASLRSGQYQIWTVNKDGSNLVPLTSHRRGRLNPSWSPNGEKIAFASSRSGGTAIWLMNPDGTEMKQVSPEGTGVYSVSWSPDSSKLVFSSTKIVSLSPWQRFLGSLSWRDPLVVALKNDYSGGATPYHLWLLDLKSLKLQQLTHGDVVDATPSWSPDGQFLAFARRTVSAAGFEPRNLWVLHIVSGAVQRLTTDAADHWYPQWSPDGLSLVYTSRPDVKKSEAYLRVVALKKAEGLHKPNALASD